MLIEPVEVSLNFTHAPAANIPRVIVASDILALQSRIEHDQEPSQPFPAIHVIGVVVVGPDHHLVESPRKPGHGGPVAIQACLAGAHHLRAAMFAESRLDVSAQIKLPCSLVVSLVNHSANNAIATGGASPTVGRGVASHSENRSTQVSHKVSRSVCPPTKSVIGTCSRGTIAFPQRLQHALLMGFSWRKRLPRFIIRSAQRSTPRMSLADLEKHERIRLVRSGGQRARCHRRTSGS